jgi:hypothetical protein
MRRAGMKMKDLSTVHRAIGAMVAAAGARLGAAPFR